ncbi:MAG: hypothetical protein IJ698_03355 [Prevotella sp.]|nr:hypothetical protein [Prevotella sp.]
MPEQHLKEDVRIGEGYGRSGEDILRIMQAEKSELNAMDRALRERIEDYLKTSYRGQEAVDKVRSSVMEREGVSEERMAQILGTSYIDLTTRDRRIYDAYMDALGDAMPKQKMTWDDVAKRMIGDGSEKDVTFAENTKDNGNSNRQGSRDSEGYDSGWPSGSGIHRTDTGRVPRRSGRGDADVYGEGLVQSSLDQRGELRQTHYEEAVGDNLTETARKNGQYIPAKQTAQLGERHDGLSGESVVYIDKAHGVVHKVKNPFAKLPMKGHAAGDVIYEHVAHNLLFLCDDSENRVPCPDMQGVG